MGIPPWRPLAFSWLWSVARVRSVRQDPLDQDPPDVERQGRTVVGVATAEVWDAVG